jgi:hypothetical protein
MSSRQGKSRPRAQTRDRLQYATLKRAVQAVGFIRRGSLVRRFMPCGKPGCACQAQPPVLHGPYYQWTRKVHGKTLTVRLTPAEAQLFAEWIANGRQLDGLVARMEAVSRRITDRIVQQLPSA